MKYSSIHNNIVQKCLKTRLPVSFEFDGQRYERHLADLCIGSVDPFTLASGSSESEIEAYYRSHLSLRQLVNRLVDVSLIGRSGIEIIEQIGELRNELSESIVSASGSVIGVHQASEIANLVVKNVTDLAAIVERQR